jgi:hypothetical protein
VFGAKPVDEVGLALELLAAHAIEAAVDVLVDVAFVVDPLKELLDEALVAVVGRADEEVVVDVDAPRQLAPVLDDLIDVRLRVEPLLLGHPVDLRSVLVRAGEEERLLSTLAVVPDEHVRGDGRVRMPDVGRRVHVVDRRRQIEAHLGQ